MELNPWRRTNQQAIKHCSESSSLPFVLKITSSYPDSLSAIIPRSTNTKMSSQIKPIKVWGQGGPNPPKVAMILSELEIPHEIIAIPFTDVKKPEYVAINPNGRVPAIHDPNTDLTLWESGAIVEYLIERYDTKQKLSFPAGSAESYHAKQWLFFQTSGQGPYYGQAAWFIKYHGKKSRRPSRGTLTRSVEYQAFWRDIWPNRRRSILMVMDRG